MARFTFKLQGVLRHRKMIEEQRHGELAALQSQMSQLQAQLRAMDDSTQGVTKEVRGGHLVGRLDLHYLLAHRRFVLGMQRKAVALAQKMAALQLRIDPARIAFVEAATQRKMIDKLREKHLERWRQEQQARDQAQMDEIGMQLSYRQLVDEEGARLSADAAAGES